MNLSIDVARDESEVDDVAAGWRRFAESAATPFQTYEWHRAWWDLVGSRDSRQERHIVCVRDQGRLVGLAPLRVERDGGRSVLRFLTESWADYQDVLVDTGFPDQEAVLDALLDHASAGLGSTWDEVALDAVSPWSELTGAARRRGLAGTESVVCPRRTLTAADAERVSSKNRAKIRLLDRVGEVEFRLLTDRNAVADRLPEFFAMHVRQWYGRPDCGLTFTDPELLRFYRDSVGYLAPRGLVGLAELTVGGRPAAYQYGFLHRDTFWFYRSAFETGLAGYSPGHVLTLRMFKHLRELGFGVFDFMAGDFAYKYKYTDQVLTTWRIGATPAGATGGARLAAG